MHSSDQKSPELVRIIESRPSSIVRYGLLFLLILLLLVFGIMQQIKISESIYGRIISLNSYHLKIKTSQAALSIVKNKPICIIQFHYPGNNELEQMPLKIASYKPTKDSILIFLAVDKSKNLTNVIINRIQVNKSLFELLFFD